MESNEDINVGRAREMLQELIANQSPDSRLLNELRHDLAQAVEAGISLREIWLALRKSGFAGNQMKLSDWLEREGIRRKMDKKGNGKRKRKTENEASLPDGSEQNP